MQYHSGWSLANSVTLLAAGYHELSAGSLGSGLYHAERGIVNYAFNALFATRMIAADWSVRMGSAKPRLDEERLWYEEDLEGYQWRVMEPDSGR